jgi:hypothetical protein
MSDEESVRRRSVLRNGIGLVTAGAGVAGRADGVDPGTASATYAETVRLTDDDALSAEELRAASADLADRYGREAAAMAVPRGVDVPRTLSGERTPETRNLVFVRAWNAGGEVADGDDVLGVSDFVLSLWRGDVVDDSGRSIYYFWLWAQASAGGDQWYGDAKVETLTTDLDLTDDATFLTDFDPNSVLDVEGKTYTVGLEASYSGVSLGIEAPVEVGDGAIAPVTGRVDAGGAGRYACGYEGCERDTTGFNAVVEVRSDGDFDPASIRWRSGASMTTSWFCW